MFFFESRFLFRIVFGKQTSKVNFYHQERSNIQIKIFSIEFSKLKQFQFFKLKYTKTDDEAFHKKS